MRTQNILIVFSALALVFFAFALLLWVRARQRGANKIVITSPKLGILNLKGSSVEPLVEEDTSAIASSFSSVEVSQMDPPRCDVLFLYCDFSADGRMGNTVLGLREIIRDSGALVVVVASENSPEGFRAAAKDTGYGYANLAVTLERKGGAFSSFYRRLFASMARGVTMPVAWNEIAPQIPGEDHADCPSGYFVCDAGQVAFK